MIQFYKDLIQSWRHRTLPNIVNRDVDLSSYINASLKKVVTVTGFRRVGKTYLLLDYASKIGQKNCIYVNFEDERIPVDTTSLTFFSDALEQLNIPQNTVLLLDEIQNIPNWSKWVRRMNESTQYQIVLTGSSSYLSSKELPTELRGRSLNLSVGPLNFDEFLRFKKFDSQIKNEGFKISMLLEEFLMFGGLPEVVLADEGKKYLLISEYFKTFVTRDIIERYHIRKESTLINLINVLLQSTEFTAGKLANVMKNIDQDVTKVTISRYLKYLEDSYFLQPLLWHDSSYRKRINAPRKPYFVDSFFASNNTIFSNNTGRLMEQKVLEKINTFIQKDPSLEVFYWRNQQKYEIDFVLQKKEETVELIQVCYARRGGVIPEREIRNLILGAKRLNCKKLTLVTWDINEIQKMDGFEIGLVSLDKYLSR